MPEENSTQAWMWQASQQSNTSWTQTGNDFALDFWSLWEDNTPAVEDVEVDSLSTEEESSDELGFDIDLWSNDESSVENTEEWVNIETKDVVENDASLETTKWKESVNDFDISMDFEWSSEEEVNTESEETISNEEEANTESEEMISNEEEANTESEEMISNEEETNTESEEMISGEEETNTESEEMISGEEEANTEGEEMISNEEEANTENGKMFLSEEDVVPENQGAISIEEDHASEWHLFHQINEDDQNEISFTWESSYENLQVNESSSDKPLFIQENTNDESFTTSSESWDWELVFDLPEAPENLETTAILQEEPEQKQPEIWDLLSNAPIDLSEQLNDTQDSEEQNLWDIEASVDWVETVDEANPSEENYGETTEEIRFDTNSEALNTELDLSASTEVSEQKEELEQVSQPENNDFLLDAPQDVPQTSNLEQNVQPDLMENNMEPTQQEVQIQPQEVPQIDERSEAVNNVVWELDVTNTANTMTPEINISAPVELSSESTSQTENMPAETETQVQSTLSLDQILDSELLSNPQYADNSTASPQNITTSSWSKAKMWIFIGVWVAALACCVAVLAFPSLGGDRKPGDTVDTWSVIENPIWIEDTHSSARLEPDEQQNPWDTLSTSDSWEDTSIVPWDAWSATAISFPEGWDDEWWDDWEKWWQSEPMPYVGYDQDEEESQKPQEPVAEELDVNQILDAISSFKLQAEQYYKVGQDSLDKQLMKYSLRLMNLCNKYNTQIENGEWVDAESYSSFKTSANKLVTVINKYMGWEDEVPVIQANIGGDSYFEWKDEIVDYIYNNR